MKPQQLTVAEKAKSALFEHGWRQGVRQAERSSSDVCLVEALAIAGERPGGAAVLTEYVRHLGFKHIYQAMAWNDEPGRTFEQVLERLDARA